MVLIDSGRRSLKGSIIWKTAPSQHEKVSANRLQIFVNGRKISDNQRSLTYDKKGEAVWSMTDRIKKKLAYRPTKAQEKAASIRSIKNIEARTNIIPVETQANNANIEVQQMKTKSLKSTIYSGLDSKLFGGFLPGGSENLYSKADKLLKGWLPGGISNTDYMSQYSIPALEERTEVTKQYQEAKDRLESMKQMQKRKDIETDHAHKLALAQQELTFMQAEDSLKQEMDASKFSWYEIFDSQERALESARKNIGREKEARQLDNAASDMRETQDYSSLDRINRSLKNDISSPPSSGFGSGLLTGVGGTTALILGLGAVFLLKK